MNTLRAILLTGLFAGIVGCRSPDFNARVFQPWGCEDATEFKARMDGKKHVFMVCIYEDHWEEKGPNRNSLHHYRGTVVKVYKGDWHVSERVSFVQGLDDRAPTNPPSAAGRLGFVFTGEHTYAEISLDTGDFTRYDTQYAPALDFVFSK